MPHMDGTGPEGKGKLTGRKLGNCQKSTDEKILSKLGVGMGKRRNAGGGEGGKRRLKGGNRI